MQSLPRGRERLHRRGDGAHQGAPGDALPGDARAHQADGPDGALPLGGYFYYTRTEEGKQYPIHCRKKGSLDAPEEIVLDLNALAEGHKFLALGAFAVSDDGSCSPTRPTRPASASTRSTCKDLATGGMLADRRERRRRRVAWAADNRRSSTRSRTRPSGRTGSGATGSAQAERRRSSTRRRTSASTSTSARTRSRGYLLLVLGEPHHERGALLRAADPDGAWKLVAAREPEHEYASTTAATASTSAPTRAAANFRLVTAPVAIPRPEHWKEVIPHRDDVMLEDVDCFAGHCVVLGARGRTRPLPRDGPRATARRHHDRVPRAGLRPWRRARTAEFDTHDVPLTATSRSSRRRRSSTTTWQARSATLLKQHRGAGRLRPRTLRSERLMRPPPDGTQIPISLVYRKGAKRDGIGAAAALRLRLLRRSRSRGTSTRTA